MLSVNGPRLEDHSRLAIGSKKNAGRS